MKNIDLIIGQNPKTNLPIRYVPPIVSESIVVSAQNEKNNVTYQKYYEDENKFSIRLTDLISKQHSKPQIITKINCGFTNLSNKGLFIGQRDCDNFYLISKENSDIDRYSVYDPRFYGYGTENRSFLNNLLGRIEYNYDDVDYVKLPQYIKRNLLDNTNINLNSTAVDYYTEMQLEQRENFQNEWLQRRAPDRLQRKIFPLHTMGNKL
jgi:hypothetical protein